MIEQLQKNQKALTEGIEGNRLAITSGSDKMDEVKRRDLEELPAYEAIEHPEIKKTEEILEEPGYWISRNDLKLLLGGEESNFTPEEEELEKINKEYYDEILSEDKLNKDKYDIKVILTDPRKPKVKVVERDYREKPKKRVATFVDTDLDEGLMNQEAVEILEKFKLPLPSKLKKFKT